MHVDLTPLPEDRPEFEPNAVPRFLPATPSDIAALDKTDAERLLDFGHSELAPVSDRPPEITPSPQQPTDAERLWQADHEATDRADHTMPRRGDPTAAISTEPQIEVVARGKTDDGVKQPDAEAASTTPSESKLESQREQILADAAARADQQLDEVCTLFGIDSPDQVSAVEKARDLIADTLAPFTVEATTRLIQGLRVEIEKRPDAVAAIAHRDGTTIGMSIAQLDPALFESHCRPVSLARKNTEAVLQDQEINAGRTFPELEHFRDRKTADPNEIPGATQRTARHLISNGVPVTTPGTHIMVVDSGHRGTLQEHLTAAYPKATYSGHYLFHLASEHDPHPDTKTGHVLHQTHDTTFPADPEDPDRIYAEKDPAVVIEHLLHGTMSTTHGHDDRGSPIHELETPSTDQINPLVLAHEYSDPAVRIAIMELAQRTVANCARTVAEFDAAGIDYRPALTEQARTCTQRIQAWAYGYDTGDPAFNALADSFVRRTDKDLVHRLRRVTTDLGLGQSATTATWHGFGQLSLADKERYVTQLERTRSSPGSATPEGNTHG